MRSTPAPLMFKVLSGDRRPGPKDHLKDHRLYVTLRRMAWGEAAKRNFLAMDVLIEILPESEEAGWLLTVLHMPVD